MTKTLIATSLLALVTGCGTDSFNPQDDGVNSAPTHGGDITVTLDEKDGSRLVYLLGPLDGVYPIPAETGAQSAIDPDGDQLFVTDMTITKNGQAYTLPEDGMYLSLEGPRLTVSTSDFVDELNTGDTASFVFSYMITDGVESIARSATVNIVGEDFAPSFESGLVGNYTKDAPKTDSRMDLLSGVEDLDGDTLTASNIVADAANDFVLSYEVSDNEIEFDIASVAASIPDGEKVTFNFSYDITDGNHMLSRTIEVNVLGVNDVPGAPLIGSYFIEANLSETDTVQTFDLTADIVEREGDAIVLSDLKYDGSSDLPFGVEFDGTTLTFDPHAFFHEVEAGKTKVLPFTFKVSDDQGNTSQGERQLTVNLLGVETNFVAAAGYAADYEDPAYLGPLVSGGAHGYTTGWGHPSCDAAIEAAAARTGDAGLKLFGSDCHLLLPNVIPIAGENKKYLMTYWFQNQVESGVPHGNPYVPFVDSAQNRIWLQTRHDDPSVGTWFEQPNFLSTEAGSPWGEDYATDAISVNIFKIGDNSYGEHYFDDLNVIEYGSYDVAAHDVLVDDIGAFDGDLSAISFTAGHVEIQSVDGENMLYVDAAGDDEISITLPLKDGAIQVGHRYMVSADVQAIGGTDATQVWVNVTNGTERIDGHAPLTTNGDAWTSTDVLLSEEASRTADVDWSMETMSLTLYIGGPNNSKYYIDNVRIIEIP